MSLSLAVEDLEGVPPEKAERLVEMFSVDRWPDPLDDGLDHAPGEARAIDSAVARGQAEKASEEEIDRFFERGGIEAGASWRRFKGSTEAER